MATNEQDAPGVDQEQDLRAYLDSLRAERQEAPRQKPADHDDLRAYLDSLRADRVERPTEAPRPSEEPEPTTETPEGEEDVGIGDLDMPSKVPGTGTAETLVEGLVDELPNLWSNARALLSDVNDRLGDPFGGSTPEATASTRGRRTDPGGVFSGPAPVASDADRLPEPDDEKPLKGHIVPGESRIEDQVITEEYLEAAKERVESLPAVGEREFEFDQFRKSDALRADSEPVDPDTVSTPTTYGLDTLLTDPTTTEKEKREAVARYVGQEALGPPEEGEVLAGIVQGGKMYDQGLGSILYTIGEVTGWDQLKGFGGGRFEQASSDIERTGRQIPGFLESLDDPDQFADWAQHAFGQGVGSSSGIFAGGTAGFLVGGPAGAFAGAALPSYMLAHGELRSELEQAGLTGRELELATSLGALPLAALEMAFEVGMIDDVFMRTARKKAVRAILEQAGKGAVKEGLTEMSQELLQHGIAALGPHSELWDPKLIERLIEAGAAGAVPGTAFGAGGGALQRVTPTRREGYVVDAEAVEAAKERARRARRWIAGRADPTLVKEAYTDFLTGLDNLRGRESKREQVERREGTERVEWVGDADNFKVLNDKLGHERGDEALQVIADALREATREEDVVSLARHGGDEFSIVMDVAEEMSEEERLAVLERIEGRVNEALAREGLNQVDDTEIGFTLGFNDDHLYQRKRERGVSRPRTDEEQAAETDSELETIRLKVPLSSLADSELEAARRNVKRRQEEGWERDLQKIEAELGRRADAASEDKPVVLEGETFQGPEVDGPVGRTTQIIPPSGDRIQARYKVVDARDLEPSHNPFNFNPNPAYPQVMQPRDYTERSNQESVERIEREFDPDRYVDATGAPSTGPSQIVPQGYVVGGNNRVMSIQRLYEHRPEAAEAFRQRQRERASEFGLSEEAFDGVERPVIVREITDPSVMNADEGRLAEFGDALNEDPQKATDPYAEAAKYARRLEHEGAADVLDHFIETVQEDETLRSYLSKASGRQLVELMVQVGVVPHGEGSRLFARDGSLTDEAKTLVERVLDAAILGDTELLKTVPKSHRNKFRKAVPAILRAAQVPGYDIRPEIQQAMKLLRAVRNAGGGISTVDEFFAQQGLGLDETQDPEAWGDQVIELAKWLEDVSQNEASKAFRAFAADAARAEKAMIARESGDLFDEKPPLPDPAEKFNRRFIARDYQVEDNADIPGLYGSAHAARFLNRHRASRALEYQPDLWDETSDPEGSDLETQANVALEDMGLGELHHLMNVLWNKKSRYERTIGFKEEARPKPFSEEQYEAVKRDYVRVSTVMRDRLVERNREGAPTEELAEEAREPEVPDSELQDVERAEAQGTLFGGAEPAEGGDQFTMFSGTVGQYTKENVQDTEREALKTINVLRDKIDRGEATRQERRDFEDAIETLNRSPRFTRDEIQRFVDLGKAYSPDEVATRIRERTFPQSGTRQPQAENQSDMFDGPTAELNRTGMEDGSPGAGARHALAGEPRRNLPDVGELTQREQLPTPEELEQADQPKSIHEIVLDLADTLKVPIRVGKHKFRRAYGVYKVLPQAIRTKWAQDLETVAHEVGHHMHWLLFGEGGLTENGSLSNKALSAWRGELDPLAEGISDETLVEGEAEFFRRFVTNPEAAKAAAPEFYAFVVGSLQDSYPGVLQALQQARDDYQVYREADPEARFDANFVDELPRLSFELVDLGVHLSQQVWDVFAPWRRIQREFLGGGASDLGVDVSKNFALLFDLINGSAGMADHWIDDGQMEYGSSRVIGPSLKEILAPVSPNLETLRRFERYATARRVLERHDKGFETGFDPDDARIIKDRYHGRPEFRHAFQQLQVFRRNQLRYLVAAGVLSPRSYKAIMEKSLEYMPLYPAKELHEGQMSGGQAIDNIESAIGFFRGSSGQKVYPLTAIVQDTYYFMNLAHRQRAMNALINGIVRERGIGWFIEHVATPVEAVPVTARRALQGLKEVFNEKALESMGAMESEEAVEIMLEGLPDDVLNEIFMVFRPGDYFGQENMISYRDRTGKRHWFEVKDKHLWRALRDRPQASQDNTWLTKMVRALHVKAARALRIGATAAPVFFASRNVARDAWTAYVQSLYGVKPGIDHVGALASLINHDEWYQRFRRAGGEFSAVVDMDREHVEEVLTELEEGKLKNVLQHPIEHMRMLSALFENLSRIAEFKRGYQALREQGIEEWEAELRAAHAARDIVTDFSRHGAAFYALRTMSAFWNAHLVSWEKMVRSFRNDPTGFSKRAFLSITTTSAVLFFVNKDNDDYWELPQWMRDTFWHIPLPSGMADTLPDFLKEEAGEGIASDALAPTSQRGETVWLRIAKPHFLGQLFGTLPERFLEYVHTNDPHGLQESLKEMFWREVGSALVPLPTLWGPLVENYFEYDLFRQRDLVPRSLQNVDPEEQFLPSTSYVARMIADLASKGPVSISPIKIDNAMRGWGGTIATDILRLGDFGAMKLGLMDERVSRGIAGAPVIGGAFSATPAWGSESVDRFYERYAASQQKYNTARKMNREHRYDEEAEYRREHADKIVQYRTLQEFKTYIDELADAQRTVADLSNVSPQEKRSRWIELEAAKATLARAALGRKLPSESELGEHLAPRVRQFLGRRGLPVDELRQSLPGVEGRR